MFFAVKEKNIFDAHEYYLEGKFDKALNLCEQILARNPDRYSAINLVASIYFATGDFSKGEQYIYKLRDHFLKNEDYDKAVASLEILHHMRPSTPKYIIDIANVYEQNKDCRNYVNSILGLAELYRKNGQFEESAKCYYDVAVHLKDKHDHALELINKLSLVGGMDYIGKIARDIIFTSDQLPNNQKDGTMLITMNIGCKPEYFVEFIPEFVRRDQGRYSLIENAAIKYFSENKNDSLFNMIIESHPDAVNLIEKVKEIAPNNVPVIEKTEIEVEQTERILEAVPESPEAFEIVTDKEDVSCSVEAEALEIDTHTVSAESEIENTPLELDIYDNSTETSVNTEITGLETTQIDSGEIESVSQIEGFETYDTDEGVEEESASEDKNDLFDEVIPEEVSDIFEADEETKYPEPSGMDMFDSVDDSPDKEKDIFADFGGGSNSTSEDIFSAFDEDAAVKPEDISEPRTEAVTHSLEDLAGSLPAEEKCEETAQIDMSDIEIVKPSGSDIFEDLFEESEEVKKETPAEQTQKISIDADELEAVDEGRDIFDKEV